MVVQSKRLQGLVPDFLKHQLIGGDEGEARHLPCLGSIITMNLSSLVLLLVLQTGILCRSRDLGIGKQALQGIAGVVARRCACTTLCSE